MYITELGEVNGPETVGILHNYSAFYSITKVDVFNRLTKSLTFTFNDRYLSETF